jgi:uncharacterized RDD family membrane protein YckC
MEPIPRRAVDFFHPEIGQRADMLCWSRFGFLIWLSFVIRTLQQNCVVQQGQIVDACLIAPILPFNVHLFPFLFFMRKTRAASVGIWI